MELFKKGILAISLIAPVMCNASISTQIDIEKYAFDTKTGNYVNGFGGPDLVILDSTDVYEYFDPNIPINNNRISLSYDVTYRADANPIDPTVDFLAFRLFAANNWHTVWGSGNFDIQRNDFPIGLDQTFSVLVDLNPFRSFNAAMGWAYISDVPSQATMTISNIRLNTVDEPSTWLLLGIGGMALGLAQRRKRMIPSQYAVKPWGSPPKAS